MRDLQRGARGGVGARGQSEAPGVAVGPDAFGALQALAARAGAARVQDVADRLRDGVGLPGQQRLVDLDARVLARAGDGDQRTVDHDLLAAANPHEVADDDRGRRHAPIHAVAHHGHRLPGEELEPVELALRAQLLRGR
jgi:hypothetical protein